jgi:hypothetical protein
LGGVGTVYPDGIILSYGFSGYKALYRHILKIIFSDYPQENYFPALLRPGIPAAGMGGGSAPALPVTGRR